LLLEKQDMIKQVLVIRKDLRNSKGEKVRTGKLIAQGSHAAMAFLTNRIKQAGTMDGMATIFLSPAETDWVNGIFTKVCLQVNSKQELYDIHKRATDLGIQSYLITDSGLTEFDNVPTPTACGIGPDEDEKVDAVTGHLKLF